MTGSTILLGTVLFAASSVAAMGQPAAPSGAQSNAGAFHTLACVKVNPGKEPEFRSWILGDSHKYQQSRVDSDAIYGWAVLRAIVPQGDDATCDYMIVTFFRDMPNQPMTDEEVTAALHKAGLSMTAKELADRRNSLAHLVYSEILYTDVLVGKANKDGYVVLNSMTTPNADEWVAFEKRVWQPFAEAMLKSGARTGWALNRPVFPAGSKDMHFASTVDMYPNWESVFKESDLGDLWKKVHPDMDIQSTMQKAETLRTIEHRGLYKVEDLIMPGK